MYRLLIADNSEIFASALAAALGKQFDIRICTDGPDTLQMLPQFQPDILIINLMLPCIDGLGVLEKSAYRPPVILAIAMHMSRYLEQVVTTLGIDYTMIAPSVNTVVLRLRELLQSYSPPSESNNLQDLVAYHLHHLGFANHLDGYGQLCIALPLFIQNPLQTLTKELYPAVAKAFGCKSGSLVEHSIRKAIHSAWEQRDNAIWRKYFTMGPDNHIPCPSNKEFLCRLAEILQSRSGLI